MIGDHMTNGTTTKIIFKSIYSFEYTDSCTIISFSMSFNEAQPVNIKSTHTFLTSPNLSKNLNDYLRRDIFNKRKLMLKIVISFLI